MMKALAVVWLLAGISHNSCAQLAPVTNWNSARILHEITKLKHPGRVLYVAAHPDDENTQLISYLSNVLGLETAYLSLTRGDGGQNLLGSEVREELGVIRTQELLMARSADGGQQFFTRANDFGFSKSASETLHIWDSNEVLSDMVWVIRKFKPDIIITRFSPTYTKTHGHHQASAILAEAAFRDAANPAKYPEQLKYVDTWQAQSLYWNTSPWFYKENKFDTAGLYSTPIGVYMPLLGESTGEMAADSRSMHKSQGMGTAPKRGASSEYFVWLEGEKPRGKNIFNSINYHWNRIKGCEGMEKETDNIISGFNPADPCKSVEALIALHDNMEPFRDNYLVQSKLKLLNDIILQCMGIHAEAISASRFLPAGDSIHLTLDLINQCPGFRVTATAKLSIDGKETATLSEGGPAGKNNAPGEAVLEYNKPEEMTGEGIIPTHTSIAGPYWLEEEHTTGMYKVDSQQLRGLPQSPPQAQVHLVYSITDNKKNLTVEKDLPVFYKYTDPVKGVVYSLARIMPPAVAIPDSRLMVFTGSAAQTLSIKVKSFTKGPAILHIRAPEGWTLDSNPARKRMEEYINFDMNGMGGEQLFTVPVSPGDRTNAKPGYLYVTISLNGVTYNRSMEVISYGHIPEQVLLPQSRVNLEKIDITTNHGLIGYINGAGDDIARCLKNTGYRVETISPAQATSADLGRYMAIIAGVRAYNTVPQLKTANAHLLDYVKNGGTYIVQYNNNYRLVTDSIAPYYLRLSSTRTTDENCKITLLNAENRALNAPNKITAADFEGWVQERGLYYPDQWDTVHFTPLLEMADPGEKPVRGALLVARYGKGYFVYTGLSFFRELPAGVQGAYRILANLAELGDGAPAKTLKKP